MIMAVPRWNDFIDPVMRLLADGKPRTRSEILAGVVEATKLTEEDMADALPSGEPRYIGRIGWAITDSFQAGYLLRPARATYTISPEGLRFVETGDPITHQTLKLSPTYQEYLERSRKPRAKGETPLELTAQDDVTPLEALREANRQLLVALEEEVYTRLHEITDFYHFEKLVGQFVGALGYGGASEESIKLTKRSNDNGVDGIIWQDKLGFDRVYLQAKKYSTSNKVGKGELYEFSGALDAHGATKGILLTTSEFTEGARIEAPKARNKHIILIDGRQLASLMVQHNIGVEIDQIVEIKRIDGAFFTFDEE
ncbi:restriction endonuclease [Paenarthrobacter ureafaciens]|uniref:restriction endonuclease n=1 Tax=Paenarthrobacter ureafaciens TaxID=37931 RepID=UPI001C4CA2AF|nr:restriction endonuclease [Paenarthrobacter ureafaciens]